MTRLENGEKRVVTGESLGFLATLHGIKSKTTGTPNPEGPVIPPYWAIAADDKIPGRAAPLYPVKSTCCHNYLSQANIIINSETLKTKAIMDWEHVGFWPEWSDMRIWEKGIGTVWGEG